MNGKTKLGHDTEGILGETHVEVFGVRLYKLSARRREAYLAVIMQVS